VKNDVMGTPDEHGRFGDFGGRFVPEALVPACLELEEAFRDAWSDPSFVAELSTGPAAVRRTSDAGDAVASTLGAARSQTLRQTRGSRHTGSHKINNVIGQTLLTQRMGKSPSNR